MEQARVGKVAAVVVRGSPAGPEVLVFDHPLDEGGLMVQLPAGTIELGEEPAAAAARELSEETGVEAGQATFVAVRDEEWDGQARRRWIYLIQAPEGLPDEWPFKCDCGAAIRCYWLPLEAAEVVGPQQPWLELAREHLSTPSQLDT